MTIKVGQTIPEATLSHMTADGPAEISTDDIFNHKNVLVFALPGAYTPTCSAAHLPGYVVFADKIKAAGIDTIACLSVNDAFVMDAWGKTQNVEQHILMLADGSAALTKALGLELDLSERHFGLRSQRYAMIVNNGVSAILMLRKGQSLRLAMQKQCLSC